MVRMISCIVTVLVASNAFADQTKEFVKADTPEKFATVVTDIHKDMDTGGRFEFISVSQRADANRDLDTMMSMLQKSGSVSAMNAQDKVALFNTQEHLNGILTHSDSERLVCEHKAGMGTHIQQTTCKTFGDLERQRRNSQDAMNRNAHDMPQLQNQACPVAALGKNMGAASCTQKGGGG